MEWTSRGQKGKEDGPGSIQREAKMHIDEKGFSHSWQLKQATPLQKYYAVLSKNRARHLLEKSGFSLTL